MPLDQKIPDIIHELTLSAPIHKIWDAVASSQGLESWLMKNTFVAELGAKFTMQSSPRGDFDGIIHCEVVVIERPYLLAFTWDGGPLKSLLVTMELKEIEGKTSFKLTHSGWTENVKMVRDMLNEGWIKQCFPRLIAYLEGA